MTKRYRLENRHAEPPGRANKIAGCDFPLTERLAGYALSLLPVVEGHHQKLMELVFATLSSEAVYVLCVDLEGISDKLPDLSELKDGLYEASDADDIARSFRRFLTKPHMRRENRFFRDSIRSLLEGLVRPECRSYRQRIDQVRSKMKLGQEEMAVIELACCYQLSAELESLLDSYNITQKAGIVSLVTGVPLPAARRIISRKSMLSRIDLVTVDARQFSVEDQIFNYLIGNAGKEFAAEAYKTAGAPRLSLEQFLLKKEQRETLQHMVRAPEPMHILFYGKAGTGKTELSKALAAYCGKPAVFVSCGEDGDERDRKTALMTTVNSVSKDTLIIIDEVDGLLNTTGFFREPRVNKAWINHFMDSSQHKVIWIANETGGIEESVRRRFSYSLCFKPLTWRQREVVWYAQLRKHRVKRFFDEGAVRRLAKRYPTSPGLIAYSVSTVSASRTPKMDRGQVQAMLDEVMGGQMELTEGVKPRKEIPGITENYDMAALHTDGNPRDMIQSLKKWQSMAGAPGLSLLFWGWPGTGKTEFAKYMAERLGKDLLVKRMSDLQSMYVGQTEKQIAAAFRQAEEEDAILFLDEADSLFIDRQTAHRSWESSQTNEVLTQMENFRGILICCTNLLDHLDEAAMRRFAFKIKFLPLTPDGILRLYRKYFPSVSGTLTPELESRLSSIRNLCPGDIKAVWQRMRFLDADLTPAVVIDELQKEVAYKQGAVKGRFGFYS